jgi:hypothetical protein
LPDLARIFGIFIVKSLSFFRRIFSGSAFAFIYSDSAPCRKNRAEVASLVAAKPGQERAAGQTAPPAACPVIQMSRMAAGDG